MVVVIGVLIVRLLIFWVPVFSGTGFWGPGFGQLILEVLVFKAFVFRVLVFGDLVFRFLIFGVLVSGALVSDYPLKYPIYRSLHHGSICHQCFNYHFSVNDIMSTLYTYFLSKYGQISALKVAHIFKGFGGSRLLNDWLVI